MAHYGSITYPRITSNFTKYKYTALARSSFISEMHFINLLAVLPLAANALPLISEFRNLPVSLINNYIYNDNIDFNEKRLVQVAEDLPPQWVTETEKLRLKRHGINFFDITELYNNHNPAINAAAVNPPPSKGPYSFPEELSNLKEIKKYIPEINADNLYNDLANFSSFHSRYYKNEYGLESAKWLIKKIKGIVGSDHIIVKPFGHSFPQFSIIVTIPGKDYKSIKDKGKVVIVGAHQDSTNLLFPNIFPAPGADDDGSGTVTVLEVLRLIVLSGLKPQNTLEFHFYAAEEGGLLGSQDIFAAYSVDKVDVISLLQQDMTGYTQKTLDAGKPPSIGIINDYVSPELTQFIRVIIDSVCSIGYVESQCGYGCSDHASANKFGYQSAFVIEADFKLTNSYIHSTKDTIEKLDIGHMSEFVKLTFAYAYELALTKF